ncbi:MAG: Ohr family peroxiredoxin [Bacillus sp. (in: firmicutes)]
MKPIYTATVTAHGGREGHVKSEDGILDFDVRQPKELGGNGEQAPNPELLFGAAYAACYQSALNKVLLKDRKKLDSTVTANVTIGEDSEDGGFMLAVRLDVSIDTLTKEETQIFADKANEVCPYSKLMRGKSKVTVIAI